jgi:hypothetical protein
MNEQLRTHLGIEANEPWPAYAWPGGYPIGYMADDGEWICAKCMNDETTIHFDGDNDGWLIVGADIVDDNEQDEHCAHCGALIAEGEHSNPNPNVLAKCPECGALAVTSTAGPLPVCRSCDWTGWERD